LEIYSDLTSPLLTEFKFFKGLSEGKLLYTSIINGKDFNSKLKIEDFKVTKGQDKLKLYQYHTKVANHYFCTECGIYTHHNPRSAPTMTGFNMGCVDEVKVEDLKEVAFFDGLNHPMDQEK